MIVVEKQPFILKLTSFLSLFGVVPWFNFKEHTLNRPKLFKCYSSVLVILLGSFCLALVCLRYQVIYKYAVSSHMACDILLDLESLITIILTLEMAHWNINTWTELYEVNRMDFSKYSIVPRSNIFVLRYAKHIFITTHLYLFCLSVNNFLFIEITNAISYYFVSTPLLTYYEFLIAFTIINVVALIRWRYYCLNTMLRGCNHNNVDFVEVVREVRRLWMKLDTIVEAFNKLFGWPLLMIYFDFFLDILCALIVVTGGSFTYIDRVYKIEADIITATLAYLIESWVWLMAITFCCDSVSKEADAVLTSCYTLEQTLPLPCKQVRWELERLEKLVKNKSPQLTAAGFFQIRRCTLLSLLGTTTTYFIVALQFNSL